MVIANAYFFPGYRLLKPLRRADRRGVRVRLVLQGQRDMTIVKHAAALLHGALVRAGVEIYEYYQRPLHGKVGMLDGSWATVGSSNLDPLSLSPNLEANAMIRDAAFATELHADLERLLNDKCRQPDPDQVEQRHAGQIVSGAREAVPEADDLLAVEARCMAATQALRELHG